MTDDDDSNGQVESPPPTQDSDSDLPPADIGIHTAGAMPPGAERKVQLSEPAPEPSPRPEAPDPQDD